MTMNGSKMYIYMYFFTLHAQLEFKHLFLILISKQLQMKYILDEKWQLQTVNRLKNPYSDIQIQSRANKDLLKDFEKQTNLTFLTFLSNTSWL